MLSKTFQREIDGEVRAFFTNLGYRVDWDYSRKLGIWWHEIYKDNKMVCQIDQGIPLNVILEDFACFAKGMEEGTSNVDYAVCAPPSPEWDELLEKATKQKNGILDHDSIAQ